MSSLNPSAFPPLDPVPLVSARLEISHFVLHGGHDVLEPHSQLFTLGSRVLIQGGDNLKGREEREEEEVRQEDDRRVRGKEGRRRGGGRIGRCHLTSALASQGLLLFANAT